LRAVTTPGDARLPQALYRNPMHKMKSSIAPQWEDMEGATIEEI
jgi:hypothetical protein